jgi:hypothetical protein
MIKVRHQFALSTDTFGIARARKKRRLKNMMRLTCRFIDIHSSAAHDQSCDLFF